MIRNVGRTFEERLRQEAEAALSMFWRRDSHRDRRQRVQAGACAGVAAPASSPRASCGASAASARLPAGLALAAGGLDQVPDERVELLRAEAVPERLRHHVRRISLRDLGVRIDDRLVDEGLVLALSAPSRSGPVVPVEPAAASV